MIDKISNTRQKELVEYLFILLIELKLAKRRRPDNLVISNFIRRHKSQYDRSESTYFDSDY